MSEKDSSEQLATGDRPKIYVTSRGARYVKADELIRSKRARAEIEALAKLDFKRVSTAESSGESS